MMISGTNASGRVRCSACFGARISSPMRWPCLCASTTFVVRRSPYRSRLQVFSVGWIQLPEQLEEVCFAHSPFFLLEDVPLWISNDRVWRRADTVTTQRCGRVRIIHVNRHGDERCIDGSRHPLIRPDLAFHDPTGDAPLAGEEEDDGLAGLGSLSLGRSVVVSPGDAVGRDVEAVPSVGERGNEGYTPEPSPQPEELASIGS